MKRLTWADALFAVQLVCTFLFGGSQFLRMLQTTQGVSITWYGFWEVFLAINTMLALAAHRAKPSKVTLQTVIVYVGWLVVITADISAMIWRGSGQWTDIDTATTLLAGSGIILTYGWSRCCRLPATDPIVKGWYALFFKAIPQFLLAWKIHQDGGAGLAAVAIVTGHITILTRLGQLGFSIKEAGWDRNRIGSAISELGNELSWLVVTAVWLYK